MTGLPRPPARPTPSRVTDALGLTLLLGGLGLLVARTPSVLPVVLTAAVAVLALLPLASRHDQAQAASTRQAICADLLRLSLLVLVGTAISTLV